MQNPCLKHQNRDVYVQQFETPQSDKALTRADVEELYPAVISQACHVKPAFSQSVTLRGSFVYTIGPENGSDYYVLHRMYATSIPYGSVLAVLLRSQTKGFTDTPWSAESSSISWKSRRENPVSPITALCWICHWCRVPCVINPRCIWCLVSVRMGRRACNSEQLR